MPSDQSLGWFPAPSGAEAACGSFFSAVAFVAAVTLIAPWLLRLSGSEVVRHMADGRNTLEDSARHRTIPLDSLRVQRELISAATGGITGVAGAFAMATPARIASAC